MFSDWHVHTTTPFQVDRGWSLAIVLVLLGGLACAAVPASAQTVERTVTGQQGNILFRVAPQGGLLAPGTYGMGTVPASGAGTRLVWAPSKGAVRAGRVGFGLSEGVEWNPSNVGDYSVAFGVNTEARGQGAVAIGQGTTARGGQSFAMGYRTSASGLRAVAFGDLTSARGNFSTALGLHTNARAKSSVALGRWNTLEGAASTWRSTDPLLVAGNGSGPSSRSNALVLQKNGNLTIAGTLMEHSDRRLKTNVEPLTSVGKALSRLQPVRFQFKEGTGHPTAPQIGLLAQDVQDEFPSLVSKGSDGYFRLAYPKLTAVLVKGVQEQQARIDSLEKRVRRLERLEEQQDRLAAELANLRSQDGSVSPVRSFRTASIVGVGALFLFIGGLVGAAIRRRGTSSAA